MIDRSTRDNLAVFIVRLIERRLEPGEAWTGGPEESDQSDDGAVVAINGFVAELRRRYTKLPPRRRPDPFRENSDLRRKAERCVLFLRSDIEYEWPPMPEPTPLEVLALLIRTVGFPKFVALLVFALFWLAIGRVGMVRFLVVGSVSVLIIGLYFLLPSNPPNYGSAKWRSFLQLGDYEAWPFIRREDLNEVRNAAGMRHRNPCKPI